MHPDRTSAKSRPTRTLSEPDSKALVACHGVRLPRERTAGDARAAARAAAEIGFPVVLKLAGDGIAHKTERGLVRVGLANTESVEREAAELLS
ncbi:acetate--CoA ligase family protein, partial [Myxococcota bacterium]|nr:acetate--CoA ligase family protein [Myxococcota bacterium]